MKKIILIFLFCLSTILTNAGIDEMKERQLGQAPTEQSDVPGNGNGNGQNPNVPFEDFPILAVTFLLIVAYGIYHIIMMDKKDGNDKGH